MQPLPQRWQGAVAVQPPPPLQLPQRPSAPPAQPPRSRRPVLWVAPRQPLPPPLWRLSRTPPQCPHRWRVVLRCQPPPQPPRARAPVACNPGLRSCAGPCGASAAGSASGTSPHPLCHARATRRHHQTRATARGRTACGRPRAQSRPPRQSGWRMQPGRSCWRLPQRRSEPPPPLGWRRRSSSPTGRRRHPRTVAPARRPHWRSPPFLQRCGARARRHPGSRDPLASRCRRPAHAQPWRGPPGEQGPAACARTAWAAAGVDSRRGGVVPCIGGACLA